MLAELAELGLATLSTNLLMHRAVRLLSEVLGARYVKVAKPRPEGDGLVVRSATGWPGGVVGTAVIALDEHSPAGRAFLSRSMVVQRGEIHSSVPTPRIVRSSVHVPIIAGTRTFGVLGLYWEDDRPFSREETDLINAVARVLSLAITRHRTEQEGRAIRERYRAAAEGSLDAFYLVEAVTATDSDEVIDFVFIDVNTKGAELIGRTSEQIIGQRLCELLPVNRTGGFFDKYVRVMRTGVALSEEFAINTPELPDKWLQHQVVPLGNGVAITTRDITSRKRVESDMNDLNAILRTKNEELEQFVYTVSHDLKSPLVTISGFIGHIIRDADAQRWDRVRTFADRINTATTRLCLTIDDLLELSRIGRVTHTSSVVDVHRLVTGLHEDYADRLAMADAALEVQCGMPLIMADPIQIGEVFDNLIGNALKYACARPGGRIEVGCVRCNDEIRFFVKDNGPGVPAVYHERIFGLFQRLDSSSPGTGVGLAIVRKIAGLSGGRAWIESTPPDGATFWFSLPESVLAKEPSHAKVA
jgi:two-component system sensor kinase FixL